MMDKEAGAQPAQEGRAELSAGAPTRPGMPPQTAASQATVQRPSESAPDTSGKEEDSACKSEPEAFQRSQLGAPKQLHQAQVLSIAREGFSGGTGLQEKYAEDAQPRSAYAFQAKDENTAESHFLPVTPVTILFKDITCTLGKTRTAFSARPDVFLIPRNCMPQALVGR